MKNGDAGWRRRTSHPRNRTGLEQADPEQAGLNQAAMFLPMVPATPSRVT